MLIDVSYFTAGPRQILNATLGKGTPKENAVIEQYIAEYQEEFLSRVLGEDAGDAMQKYLDDLDSDPEADTDKDMDAVCSKLRKPFADYVFFYILRDSGQTASITGLVRLKVANQYVEPIVRQVSTWNRMVNSLNVFAEWVDSGECPVPSIVIDKYMLEPINRFNL
ncbi:MAG: hypothetical protein NC421_07530 [Lachnospiraceae bacterium]|nr:hypothetical protein [Lachnospiraceae bacterium]